MKGMGDVINKPRMIESVLPRVCLGLVVVLIVVVSLVQVFWPYNAVQIFGFKTSLVSDAGSMEPSLGKNDYIVIKKANFDEVHKGDTIAFLSTETIDNKKESVVIVHTVVEIVTDKESGAISYRTQGINESSNPVPDLRPVTVDGANGSNLFIGKYAFTVPVLGQVYAFVRSPYGLTALLINASVIMAIRHIAKRTPIDEEQTALPA